MRRPALILFPLCLFAAAPAIAQSPAAIVPTIPESQIAPAPLSSPFEFLSVATSADVFIVRAAALAETNTENGTILGIARGLSDRHQDLVKQSQAVAIEERVDIGEPGVDGEQSRLLGRLQALKGPEFDAIYLDSQIFVHQRTIAYYRGGSERAPQQPVN
jgi:putative membrane protein